MTQPMPDAVRQAIRWAVAHAFQSTNLVREGAMLEIPVVQNPGERFYFGLGLPMQYKAQVQVPLCPHCHEPSLEDERVAEGRECAACAYVREWGLEEVAHD